jgi:glucokinase
VIIGGAITRIGDPLFTPLRDNLLRQLSDPFMDHLLVIPAKCGVDGGVIGSAALALEGRKVAV